MSKSKRALLQIGLSLILAMVAGVIIFNWTSKIKAPVQPTAQKSVTVPVVVAAADLRRGVKLTEKMLEVREYTTDSRPSGAFDKAETLVGRVLSVDVGGSEAVTARKLADESVMGGGVSALIAPGKRAMAVKGNIVMGLAGFVRPGDRVDVIVSMNERDDKPVTKLVLEMVKVLATGTQLSPPDQEGKTSSVDVYTLELSPEQSERLALAASQGSLHFALRNEQDEANVLTTGADVQRTLASLRPKSAPGKVRRASERVEIITGSSRSSVKF